MMVVAYSLGSKLGIGKALDQVVLKDTVQVVHDAVGRAVTVVL